jgi:hypothetical protein
LFLNLEFFFSRTRGSAGAIANPYAISYCLSTFYFSKLLKNLTNYAFSSGKTCEKYSEFPANQTFARIILLWLQKIMGLSRLGTRLVVVFLYGMRPHAIRDVESILRVILKLDRDSAILCHPMPFLRSWTWFAPRLVSFRRGLSRAVTCSYYAVIFPRLRSCRLCWDRIWEPDCAVTRAQLKWGWSAFDRAAASAVPCTLELISGTPTLGPELNLCPCNVPTTLSPPHQANKKRKQVLGVGILEGRELPGGNTWGTKTSRGIAVISCDSHLIGGH